MSDKLLTYLFIYLPT